MGGFGGNALGDLVTGETFNPVNALESAGGGALGGALGAGSSILNLGEGLLGAAPDLAGGLGSDAGFAGAVGGDVVPGGAAAAAPAAEGSLAGTTAAAAGATPAAVTDPFNLPTTGLAGGAPSSGLPGVATGESNAELASFATPNAATGGAATLPDGTPIVDPAAAPSAGDLSFADQSGAFGGLGGAAAPTAGELAGSSAGSGLGGISKFFKDNKELLGAGVGAAGIAKQLFGGTQGSPNQAALEQLLQQLQQQYQQLQGGQLTPAQAQQFQNNLAATISQINSTYAAHGMGGNSTSAMEDKAAAQASNTAGQAQAQSQNLNTGLQAAGLTARTADSLLTNELTQDAALSQAIARLAAAGLS